MMVMQIALGIVVGFLLLAAIVFLIFFASVFISKRETIRTVDRYDFDEEEDDYADEYQRRDKKIGR